MAAEENRNKASQISVRVLFFGAARDAVGQAEITFSLTSPTSAASAFEQVLEAFPDLRRFGRSLLFAVNEEYARPEREVLAGDELAVFPSVSGGSQPDEEMLHQEDTETREQVVGVSLRGHPNVAKTNVILKEESRATMGRPRSAAPTMLQQ